MVQWGAEALRRGCQLLHAYKPLTVGLLCTYFKSTNIFSVPVLHLEKVYLLKFGTPILVIFYQNSVRSGVILLIYLSVDSELWEKDSQGK